MLKQKIGCCLTGAEIRADLADKFDIWLVEHVRKKWVRHFARKRDVAFYRVSWWMILFSVASEESLLGGKR